jgi:hypothetical protein
MSKRFTETAKWEDPWFRALSPTHKALWQWLLDKCDCAGVLAEVDWPLASFQIGAEVTAKDLAAFAERVEHHGKRLWVRKFVSFQYGSDLNDRNPAHRGVLKALKSANIDPSMPPQNPQGPAKDLQRGLQALKDKDKDKDKDVCTEGVQGEPKPEPKPKPERQRNPLFDALAEATDGAPGQLTKAAARAVGVALAEIRRVCPELTPVEITRRAEHYRSHFRDATLTASALAKHWARCDRPLNGSAPDRRQLESDQTIDELRTRHGGTF